MAYTAYTRDGTYWTLRNRQAWYLVCRLRSGTYEEAERYGWYRRPGAAGTAVGALAYREALAEARDTTRDEQTRGELQRRVDEMAAHAIPTPEREPDEPVPADGATEDPDQAE